MNKDQMIGKGGPWVYRGPHGTTNISGWEQYHAANWSAIEGDAYKTWAFSPHM